MRSKLFLAFFAVILMALISNLIFERLILRDFEEYVMGAREDRLYWVMASLEGSYREKGWNRASLSETLHWAMMLGYDAELKDKNGDTVLTSGQVLQTLPPSMKKRMEFGIHLYAPEGEFEEYPLYVEGNEIGTLRVRPLRMEGLPREKEAVFKDRGRDFLLSSFLIAGGGAVFLSIVLSLFLTQPVRRLKHAAEAVAKGDLDVKVKTSARDEIGRLTETFNCMVETLKRQEALRRHLTSNIAHELRTPLTVAKANIEALIDGVLTDKNASLENIRAEINRLIKLVEGIEDATKAEASFLLKAEYVKVDLRDFIKGIARGMMPMFLAKGIELNVLKKDSFQVMVDAEKLETIIRNLLSNSLRHTEKADTASGDIGGVWIDYGEAQPPLANKEFFIEIKDTGKGIEEQEQAKVFKRFYRGEGSEGIGLGLSIAKELVDVMGGRIELKSKPHEGVTVRVILPMKGS